MFYHRSVLTVYSNRETFEMCQLISAKFCTLIRPRPDFVMLVRNFGNSTPKKFSGQKHAKFGPISDDYKIW